MVENKEQKTKRQVLSIDEMIQILVNHGNIGDIRQTGKDLSEEEKRLSRIVRNLKVAYRKGKLSESQIETLKNNGMTFERKEAGRSALDILIASGRNIGDIKQKGKDLTEEERRLGEAKHNLKAAYKQGILSERIIREAEAHGMVWNEQEAGKSMLDILIESGRNIGDIRQNGKDLSKEEKRLGNAKHSLKVAYARGLLSERIIREAEAHGMVWDEREIGRKMLNILIASGRNIGSIKQRGKGLTEEERKLGQVKQRLKIAYNRGLLSEDVIREAEAHGMVWNEQQAGRRILDFLIASGINIGDIRQKGKNLTEEERRLGNAKHSLKVAYSRGQLSEDIIREAESYGMVWMERRTGRKKSSLESLRRQKDELEDKEEKARALLEEVQEQVQRQEGEQSKDALYREEY